MDPAAQANRLLGPSQGSLGQSVNGAKRAGQVFGDRKLGLRMTGASGQAQMRQGRGTWAPESPGVKPTVMLPMEGFGVGVLPGVLRLVSIIFLH